VRTTSKALASVAVAIALTGAPSSAVPALAQSTAAEEGAVFLLAPIGARAVGTGQAAVALKLGSDGIWWNPASLGWARRREFSLDHSTRALAPEISIRSDALDFVFPAGRAGVLAASVLYFDFGQENATDQFGTTIGTLSTYALVASAAYAATFGTRVSAGVTLKHVRQVQTCSGSCAGREAYEASTNAFDLGAQVMIDSTRRLLVGAALRNFGFGLQIKDAEQTDPLPARLHIGASYGLRRIESAIPGAKLDLTAEIVTKASFGPLPSVASFRIPELRAGAELRFVDRFMIRGGVLANLSDLGAGAGGDGSRAVIGFGIRQGTLGLDFARSIGGEASNTGEPPTYVTIRMAFR
jgi:hypothetical protein